MRLGLTIGYSGAKMSLDMPLIEEAERLGFYSVWSAEAYGSDAVTPLAYIAALTTKIKLGTSIMQIPGRTPAMCARLLGSTVTAGSAARGSALDASPWLQWLTRRYRAALETALVRPSLILLAALSSLAFSLLLLLMLPRELAPLEDTGWFAIHVSAPEGATLGYTDRYAKDSERIGAAIPEMDSYYTVVRHLGHAQRLVRSRPQTIRDRQRDRSGPRRHSRRYGLCAQSSSVQPGRQQNAGAIGRARSRL